MSQYVPGNEEQISNQGHNLSGAVCTGMYLFVQVTCMYWYIPCFTGFCGAQRDPNMSNVQHQPTADPGSEIKGDNHAPCQEDEEFLKSRLDVETMEEAINKFMDGIMMEDLERGGFKDMQQFVKHLPVPTAKTGQTMIHTDALEGCFLPSMTNN